MFRQCQCLKCLRYFLQTWPLPGAGLHYEDSQFLRNRPWVWMSYSSLGIFRSEWGRDSCQKPFLKGFSLLELMSGGRVGGDTGLCNWGKMLSDSEGIHPGESSFAYQVSYDTSPWCHLRKLVKQGEEKGCVLPTWTASLRSHLQVSRACGFHVTVPCRNVF